MVHQRQISAIVRLKIWITLVATASAGILCDALTASSVFLGGAVAFLGSLAYTLIAYSKNKYVAPTILIKRHASAELIKMGLTMVAFALIFVFFRAVVGVAVLIGYLLATTAYWLGLLFKFGEN
jgi:ATP synthase protein I